LAASVCVGDSSSSAPDCTSTSSVMPLSVHEIAQLRCLLDAWDSSPTDSECAFRVTVSVCAFRVTVGGLLYKGTD
jgi:hypothetical protein